MAICRALEAQGIEPEPLLAASGLERADFLNNPDGRVDVRQMTRFWVEAREATGDEAFGLVVASYVQPMHFRALGMLMHTAGSLEQAVMKVGEYSAMVSNSAHIRLDVSPSSLGFCIDPIPGVEISPLAVDSFLATMTRFVGQLGNQQPFVDRVELMRTAPKHAERWDDAFHSRVVFGADQNGVWFNRHQLKQGVLMGDPQLSAFNESVVQSYIGTLQSTPFTHRVRQSLLSQLEHQEPKLASIAAGLGLTERSLRRHLRDEGASFRDLLHQCRMELAVRYLGYAGLSITDIALRVGFTDTANFSRAFTRTYGRTPSEYRSRVHSG